MEGNDTSHIRTHTVRFREEKIEQDLQKEDIQCGVASLTYHHQCRAY